MNNATLTAFIFLIIAFFGLGYSPGYKAVNDTITIHCERIAEEEFNGVFNSIEECQIRLRG